MKPINKIERGVQSGAVTLRGRHETKITFLGSSSPASVHPGQSVDSLTVSVGEEEAIIAVQTAHWEIRGKHQNLEYNHFLLLVTPRNGKPWVELDDAWVPTPDRLGQIVPGAGLSVRIGDEFFLAPILVGVYEPTETWEGLRKKYRLVSAENANLLCRFIAGTATAEEVKAAADDLVVQTVDVPALREKLKEAEERAMSLDTERLRIRDMLNGVKEELELFRKEASERELKDLLRINELKQQAETIVARVSAIAGRKGFWDTSKAQMESIRSFLATLKKS